MSAKKKISFDTAESEQSKVCYKGLTPYKDSDWILHVLPRYLYVAGYLKETQLWANITQDNEVIFHDNDFEVFVDPYGTTHNYRELEVNALGKQWSLLLNKPYGDGGSENSRRVNPTGGFDLQAVVAVSNDGQVNDRFNQNDGLTICIDLLMNFL